MLNCNLEKLIKFSLSSTYSALKKEDRCFIKKGKNFFKDIIKFKDTQDLSKVLCLFLSVVKNTRYHLKSRIKIH